MSNDYTPTISENLPPISDGDQSTNVGSVILERYRVFRRFPSGGMGIVYAVEDIYDGREYAIKRIQRPHSDASGIKAVIREIEVLLKVRPHLHIVQLLSVTSDEVYLYLMMEYVSGGTARDELGSDWHSTQQSIPLPRVKVLKYAVQMGLALECLHDSMVSVVHADLKPENILLTTTGDVKVTDFGISTFASIAAGTFSRQLSGTPAYMSPEQIRGERLDTSSDIFSFGVLGYRMLTGELPYPIELPIDPQQAKQSLRRFYSDMKNFETDDISNLPWKNSQFLDTLQYIFLGCMMPKRSNRWRSFREVNDWLKKAVVEESSVNEDIFELTMETREEQAYISLHERALALYQINNYDEALRVFNSAITQNPANAELWRDAAHLLSKMGLHDSARQFLLRAKSLNPNIDERNPRLGKI